MHFVKKLFFYTLPLLILGNLGYAKKSYSTNYMNGIAAIVEDQIITVDELNRELLPFLVQVSREARSQEDFDQKVDYLRHQALENLVDQVIVVKKFKSRNGFIPQTALDNNYNHYIKTNFKGERGRFIEFLRSQGRTDRQFREYHKEQLIVQVFRNQMLKSQSEISPERINKFYNDNTSMFFQEDAIHLRQIVLIPNKEEESNAFMARAKDISEKLSSGDDFVEVAKEYSTDDRRKSGGDWGWINRSDIHEELAQVAFSLEKRNYSEPVLFNDSLFIMYVEDRRVAGNLPLEQVHDEIEKILSTELTKKVQIQRLERFRKKAYMKYFI